MTASGGRFVKYTTIMPSSSALRFLEPHRQLLWAAREIGINPSDVRLLQGRRLKSLQQNLHRQLRFEPCELRADAEVRPGTEGHDVLRLSPQVEHVGVGILGL